MVERGPTVGEYKAMTQRGGGCCEGGGGWGEGGDIQFSLQIHLVMEGIEMLWFVHRQGLLLSCVRRCSVCRCAYVSTSVHALVSLPGMGVCAHACMHMCVNGVHMDACGGRSTSSVTPDQPLSWPPLNSPPHGHCTEPPAELTAMPVCYRSLSPHLSVPSSCSRSEAPPLEVLAEG